MTPEEQAEFNANMIEIHTRLREIADVLEAKYSTEYIPMGICVADVYGLKHPNMESLRKIAFANREPTQMEAFLLATPELQAEEEGTRDLMVPILARELTSRYQFPEGAGGAQTEGSISGGFSELDGLDDQSHLEMPTAQTVTIKAKEVTPEKFKDMLAVDSTVAQNVDPKPPRDQEPVWPERGSAYPR